MVASEPVAVGVPLALGVDVPQETLFVGLCVMGGEAEGVRGALGVALPLPPHPPGVAVSCRAVPDCAADAEALPDTLAIALLLGVMKPVAPSPVEAGM